MADIPKPQKAIIYDQPGTISTKIVDREVMEPGPGEVLINLYVDFTLAVTILITTEHILVYVILISVS